MTRVKKKNKQTIYDILHGQVPRSFNESKAKHQGRGINVFRNATHTQPTLLPQEPTKNLSDYSTSKKDPNDVAGKLQGKPSMIKRIGQVLLSIIKLPVVLFIRIFDFIKGCISKKPKQSLDIQDSLNIERKKEENLTNDTTKLNGKEDTLSKFEETYLLGYEKYYQSEEEYDTREAEYYLNKEIKDEYTKQQVEQQAEQAEQAEQQVAVIAKDETIATNKTKMLEQISLYQTTETYKKSRNEFKQLFYKFSEKKLFPIFYGLYKFDMELYNKGKSWIKRHTVFSETTIKTGINWMHKTKILKEFEQLYDIMFVNINKRELQQSLQQETPTIVEDIINTTEIKIQTMLAKLVDEQVTLSDYENASNIYLGIFEENKDADDLNASITNLFHEVIETISSNYNTDDIREHIKYIIIAYLIATVEYPKQELDAYLDASKNK